MKVEKSSTITTAKQETLQQQQQQQQLQNQLQNRKSSVWSREKINNLIELYKKHECLWNHWHEAYKNKDKRNRAIEDICNKLQIPKFEFGKKIHNLRNQFNTEMKKLEQRIEEAGVSLDDPNAMDLRCKWSHFDSLMFLRHVIEPRPGGYQTNFPPPKKMRLKFDYNSAEDDLNTSTALANSSSNSNNTNPEDQTQFQYDEVNVTEEVITDDYQSFENEVVEVEDTNCREEVYDQKYQPPTQTPNSQDVNNISTRSFTKSTNNKKTLQNFSTHNHSSASSSSQTDIININEDSSIIELSSNNLTLVNTNNHNISSTTTTTSIPTITTPIISSITSCSSNRPVSILRDQWDAFGELVANEFRNLNSEISRKRLKRKIMQAMLEVGEEDDNLLTNRSGSN